MSRAVPTNHSRVKPTPANNVGSKSAVPVATTVAFARPASSRWSAPVRLASGCAANVGCIEKSLLEKQTVGFCGMVRSAQRVSKVVIRRESVVLSRVWRFDAARRTAVRSHAQRSLERCVPGRVCPRGGFRMTKYCGCAGCSSRAHARIEHPYHGERVVYESHINGMEVLQDVR